MLPLSVKNMTEAGNPVFLLDNSTLVFLGLELMGTDALQWNDYNAILEKEQKI